MCVLEKSREHSFPNFYIMACFKQEANYNRTDPISTFVLIFLKNRKTIMDIINPLK